MQFDDDWEPGYNIKWAKGHSDRAKHLSAAFLMLTLAALSFFTICAALAQAGCARFVNHGDAFEKGVFEKGDSIRVE